ncbi:hypothetical protein F4561_002630 [Lipingzhangella halophila]|uniref:Uncharacterized protein n=1 Tax=Lipingzhangella halophila TaxID=1783352 RepID=A0A7W7RH03_9ACTN|nr:hypothetical protein [Lipingzhangella halophila]MBB4931810.1 hypothetical protein [Lipingzhangella halophila]
MGVRLIVEVLDYAPDSLTPRERYVLVALAENARDTTRTCWPGFEDDETFVRRCRVNSRSQRYTVLKALIAKGAVENIRRGQKGVRAGYRIAPLAPAGASFGDIKDDIQGPENQDAESEQDASQHPENQDAENQDADAQGPGFAHSGSRFSNVRVPKTGTPSPQSPQSPHTYDPPPPDSDDGTLFATEPEPEPKAKRKTRVPDDFTVTPEMRAWAKEKTPLADVDFETEQFLDHWRSKGELRLDWTATWRTWMRNRQKWNSESAPRLRSVSGGKGANGVVGGTRSEVPDHEFWDNITDEELRNIL